MFDRLEALRSVFLGEASGRRADYWQDDELLAAYHQFFGARIRSKWDAVLQDAKARGFDVGADARVVDWGCGTGVAAQAFQESFGSRVASWTLFDRSAAALRFAETQLTATPVSSCTQSPALKDAVVLLSHVANELSPESLTALIQSLQEARAILWVEPGTPAGSAAVISAREALRTEGFSVVAPCTHAAACGMLAPENRRHWCHFFAPPDPMVFRSGEWRQFSETLKVDLRSLPTSYLVLQRRAAPPSKPLRVIGRARSSTGYSMVLGCTAEGVADAKRLKRFDPAAWKRLKDGAFAEYL